MVTLYLDLTFIRYVLFDGDPLLDYASLSVVSPKQLFLHARIRLSLLRQRDFFLVERKIYASKSNFVELTHSLKKLNNIIRLNNIILAVI